MLSAIIIIIIIINIINNNIIAQRQPPTSGSTSTSFPTSMSLGVNPPETNGQGKQRSNKRDPVCGPVAMKSFWAVTFACVRKDGGVFVVYAAWLSHSLLVFGLGLWC